jgi:hypothetical protein
MQLYRPDAARATGSALRYERAHFRAAEGNWPDFAKLLAASPGGSPY